MVTDKTASVDVDDGVQFSRNVLIVDDDVLVRNSFEEILNNAGYTTTMVETCAEALTVVKERAAGVAFLDIKLPDGHGTQLLADLKKIAPDWIAVIITAHADLDTALTALEQGAYQYLRKPVRPKELLSLLDKIFDTLSLREQKRDTEKALRASEERFRTIFETAEDAIFMKDEELKYVLVNPSAERLFGMPSERMIGQTDRQIFGNGTERLDERVLQGEVIEREHTRDDNGTSFAFHEIRVPLRNDTGDPVGICGISRDITEKRKLESQLLRSQKMEAIGTVAGGIAHDFNNILGAIVGHTELSRLNIMRGDNALPHLDEVLKATKRATDLVRQILTFSRQDDRQAQPTDISSVVQECLRLMRASLPSTIEIQKEISEKTCSVIVNATEVHQVLMNLATNAAHAMTQAGGTLTVKLENVDFDDEVPAEFGGIRQGPYVLLTISDTGCGMDEETRKQIFDPYFTTKEKDVGTGLGLAVVDGIITKNGGAVAVDSRLQHGTTFKLVLPRIEIVAEEENQGNLGVPEGDECILFVDDEEMLVEIGEQILTRLGYQVVAKSDPQEALDTFKQNPEKFDLVITDMTMPHVTGDILAREIQLAKPNIPIIICSGFSEPLDQEKAASAGIKAFVMKPMVMKELAETIRSILD